MPRQVDHEQRRREIAEATWRAIDELGVDGTTMRAIADRAACTTGRLNHYFERREDMLVAALRLAHERAGERMANAVRGKAGRDAVRAVLLEALPLDDERRAEWKVWLTFWTQAISVDALRLEHERRYQEWRSLVLELVRHAAPARSRDEIGRIADSLVALVDGLGVEATVVAGASTLRRARRVVDTQLELLLPS